MHQELPLDIEGAFRLAEHPVRLAGMATAVPPFELPQDLVKQVAERILGPRYPHFQRLLGTFTTSGVKCRYSICPIEWFEQPRTWPERTARYLEGATDLFIRAASAALEDAGWQASDVDTVITVSSTGIATPTLEAQAFKTMGFRRDVHRVPVFGLGCAGGVTGLALAQRLARSAQDSHVLLVCVETCTPNFRADRFQKADIIATVLFGDGAAAVCVGTDGRGGAGPILGAGVEHLWPDTLNIMGWDVDPTGFGVIFDRSIPSFVEEQLADAVEHGLHHMELECADVARFICHPGGAKVLEAIETTLGVEQNALTHEREVLRDFGNMSAPTVLFVLQRVMRDRPKGQTVLAALGPGFTASLLPIRFEG